MRLGINKQAIYLAVFLLFTASAGGQTGKSVKYQFNGNLQKNDVVNGNQSTIINYSISELNIDNIVNDHGSFYRISIPGHTPNSIAGKPELPVYSRLITIPFGAECKVKVSEVTSARINPSKEKIIGVLFPRQESQIKTIQQNKPAFLKDKVAYSTRGIINSDTVTIESIGTVRNKRLASVHIYPIRYNPKSNVLEVITSMKIEITFTYSDKISSKSLLPETKLFNESLGKGVLNYNSSDLIPGYTNQPVQMVIITDTAFKKQLEPFIRWKTQKGYKLRVLYKGTGLAGNTYIQLKDTLTKIYNAATLTDPAPEYLLIIGDTKRIPYYGTGNITDMYYGEFTGNGDYIPEMFIGRLPVADTSELKTVVSKIIQYEKFQFADTNKFYNAAAAVAGYDGGYASYMNGQVKYAVSNYLNTTNKITGNPFYYFSNLSASGALSARNDSVIKMINNGVSFINYTGHGDAYSWLHLNFTMDTARVKNKNMYPLVISNACQTAKFNTPTSLGNKMVLTANKGAIGFIGCSNDSYWDEDFYWAVGACTPSANPTFLTTGPGAYDRLFHTHNESASNWYFTMGQINYSGNLAVSESTTSWKKYYWETYNLIGDPSVIPILGTPDHFNVSLPDTLPNGIKTLSLNVDPFAYAAVSHFDKLWDASYSSPSGSVMLNMPGTSNDSCLVVITGQNKVPVIKTIRITNFTKEYINLTSTSINDSQGNGNGLADFGEKFYLKLKINNLGLTGSTGLYARISSTSNLATVTKDSVYIGTLAAQSEIIVSEGLGITISRNAPDMERITLNLTLKDDKSTKNYPIDIIVHAPDLQIINCIIDDSALGNGNFIADPGETFNLIFKVRNQGSSNISGLFSLGVSPDNGLSIPDPSPKSCTLNFGQITDIPITVKLSDLVLSGSTISVSSKLDCSPIILNKSFSFRVGKIRESFEASSFNVFPWINISSIPWTISGTVSYDGNISAKSGAIPNSGTTTMMIRNLYTTADSIKFFYKVSSELNYDFFSFKLNGTEIFRKSGEVDWTQKVIAVPAGLNKMEWIYSKDGNQYSGSDCAWVDMIDFANSSAVSYIQKDLQMARIITPVQKDKYGQGTVTVKVLNLGKDVLNSFNLAYEINNHNPVKQKFDNQQVMPFGDTATVSFTTKTDLSKYGIYNIVAYGYDNNDDYLLNDTLQVKIENTEIHDSLGIYPNPFSDQFTVYINSKTNDKVEISVTNISGVKLYSVERSIVIGKNALVISDIRLFPALYYVSIRGTLVNKTIPLLKVNK